MNCEIELKKKDSTQSNLQAITSAGVSTLPMTSVNCEELHANETSKEGFFETDAKGLVRNDASSSEFSIRSETLKTNCDALQSTDSDCHSNQARDRCAKKARSKSHKRKAKSLIPGLSRDWESNDSWTSEQVQEDCTLVAEEIEKRKKIKSLQQKNRRLKVRHSRLKAAIKEMKATMKDKN
ncbi:uncharacterized protein LOC124176251 [Neodiprion fabricii]|uniref:uncharacterized protein LOC124176251 n=1 Tax=Neodiprion fabricii TaxID=2872261 RepID=UPI001ED963A6|nr:uncharacterized protein LOC124176251 [Neodiprion fabricii]XP_046413216.1 uncharacterized protein LOC124176251 [Neodiprion fabricii]XP_046413217.1 uncharacterized protein LOC124176251 [Neodiprion fabricii]